MLKIGDFVRTKEAIELEGNEGVLFQWGGEIVYNDKTDPVVEVKFDAPSINNLPDGYWDECEELGLDWEGYFFEEVELEKIERRDTPKELEAAKKAIIQKLIEKEEEESVAYNKQMKDWSAAFEKSQFFEEMTDYQKENANFATEIFGDLMKNYQWLDSPDEWTAEDVREVCLDVAPRKISTEIEFFENYGAILIQYFKFLEDAGYMKDTADILKCLEEIKDDIASASQDPSKWGIAKSFMMNAFNSGVDLEDPNAIDAFMRQEQQRAIDDYADPFGGGYSSYQEPIRKSLMDKIGRNQKVTVQYTDGRIVEDIKHKKVEKDIKDGKCRITKF